VYLHAARRAWYATVMLPNLFLAGAARSGTTSLWRYLACHDGVFFPALKEPKHFTAPDNRFPHRGPGDAMVDAQVVHGRADYTRLFDQAGDAAVVGDASIDAMYFAGAPQRMREACADARVVVLLRDPVARAFSAYKSLVLSGRETLPFEEALEREPDRVRDNWEFLWHYDRVGRYSEQVARVLAAFGRERVHVLQFEALVDGADGTLASFVAGIGLQPQAGITFPHSNESTIPAGPLLRRLAVRTTWHGRVERRMPRAYEAVQRTIQSRAAHGVRLADSTRRALQARFADERCALEGLLGHRIDWWREAP
jgi:hypothetical protein